MSLCESPGFDAGEIPEEEIASQYLFSQVKKELGSNFCLGEKC